MTIQVSCPTCNKQLQIPAEFAGQRGRCNGCRGEIFVPTIQASPPPISEFYTAHPELLDGEKRYGSFWRRVAAYILDQMLLAPSFLAVAILVALPVTTWSTPLIETQVLPQWRLAVVIAVQVALGQLYFFAGLPYFALCECTSSASTVGKVVLGLKVERRNGERARFGRCVARYLGKLLSGLTLVGLVLPLFNRSKRALHDFIAGTVVVTPQSADAAPIWVRWTLGISIVLIFLAATYLESGVLTSLQ